MEWLHSALILRPLRRLAAGSAIAVALAGLAGGCSYTLVEKPGSAELIDARRMSGMGDRTAALAVVESGLSVAEDPAIKARLHYDRARLMDRTGRAGAQDLVQELEASRRLGYLPAILFLAELHANGRLGAPDRARAAALYQEIYRADPRAAIGLARLVKQGQAQPSELDVDQLVGDAIVTFEREAAAGNTMAARELATLYSEGLLVPQDPARAEAYLAQAIRLGDQSAVTDLAELWVRTGQTSPVRVRRMLEDAAGRGSRPAMVELARAHRGGTLGEKDPGEALRWFRRAREAGEAGLEVAIAETLLDMPDARPEQLAEATALLDEAVAHGIPEAALARGRLYATGRAGSVDQAAAARLFEIAADAGVADGAVELGRAYAEGAGVPADPSRAVALWQRGLELGATSVYKDLGEAYATGFGTPIDRRRAAEYLQIAATGGSISATTRLAELYEEGIEGSPDLEAAARWYKTAAEKGSISGATKLAALYERGVGGSPDLASAARWYEVAARQGSLSSMGRLIEIYGDDRSPLADPAKAVEWLQVAARTGDASAAFDLAKAYATGRGVARDPGRASEWLEQYVTLRPEQKGTIARAYATGLLGPPDLGRALVWYRRAAESGDARAMRELAEAYEQGIGVAVDDAAAGSWYERAARAGDVVAMRRLADRLIASGGVDAAARAMALWRRAAERNDVPAMRALARSLASGLGQEIDPAQAVRWYETAARAGDAESQYQLGMMYLQGLGVERNPDRARTWLRAAQRNSVEMAGAALDALRTFDR